MSFYYEEDLIFGILSGLLTSVPSLAIGIASYVLTALAIQTMAQRRGLNNPWLAWIPVANCWLLGSLSDQYRYVVKRENTSRRKWLLGLRIAAALLTTAVVVLAIVVAAGAIHIAGYGARQHEILSNIMGPLLAVAGVSLPLVGVSIAYAVIRYMALYDVYKSMDPNNCVVFLVLSILFHVTEPFFLFFSRNKDGGMPPRRQPEPAYAAYEQPQWQQEAPEMDFWEQEEPQNKDYL